MGLRVRIMLATHAMKEIKTVGLVGAMTIAVAMKRRNP